MNLIRFATQSLFLTAPLALVAAIAGGCSSTDNSLGSNGSNVDKGELDAGTGLCGSAACAAGELCCAGTDSACSPTCMAHVSKCPVLGRACSAPDSGVGGAGGGTGGTGGAGGTGGTGGGGAGGGPSTDGGVIDAGHPGGQWYVTCGDVLCSAKDAGTTPPDKNCAKAGTSCSTLGDMCDDGSQTCGAKLICADKDPKAGIGGCPISSKTFKNDIKYVGANDLEALHDEVLQMKLATYNYKLPYGDPDTKHLGFIIEDQPQSLSVERGKNRVDMYGYLSMVVATMQVQEKEIQELRTELQAARAAKASR